MSTFDDFIHDVESSVTSIAATQAGAFAAQARADGQAFVDALKTDLQTWTQEVAAGTLAPADFEFLVRGKADLAKMNALTAAGMAAVAIDQLRSSIITAIVTAAGKLI